MIDATPALAPERAALVELLRGVASDDWDRPTECPQWSVKGIALHILGDDLSLLSRQRDASLDGITRYARDHAGLDFPTLMNGFNEQWVHASQFISVPLIIELLGLVGEWSDDFYCHVGLDTIAREPVGFFAQTDPSPYWQVIAREYAERVIHQSQIRRAIGAPEVGGELLTWMARVVVHALAYWLRDYDAPEHATIMSDWGAAGSWTWQRDGSQWTVHEGAPDKPTSRVSVAADRVVGLLTRGISPSEVEGILTFSGDTALAQNALARTAPLLVP